MGVRHRWQWVLLAVGLGVNAVFTLACVLPGCGQTEVPDAPDDLVAGIEDVYALGDTAVDTAADTGNPETGSELPCSVDGPPSLSFGDVPDELFFQYGGRESACAGPGGTGHAFGLAVTGLAAGPVELVWSVEITGRDSERLDGTATRTPECGLEGESLGLLRIDLPKSADGEEVTVSATATDSEGTQATATATFIARID